MSTPIEPNVVGTVEPAVMNTAESGTAGPSARREFERRKAKRENASGPSPRNSAA
ncbi:hypothetical protein [Terrabacter sp. Ter38]|uniref:hypothetical protein n=1 Tax=Terrabacter sp. Ter38 TaxID=2926030 RepID=UPI002117E7AA|nr:hypothetical protein [Terrabacter sp. Ter38]